MMLLNTSLLRERFVIHNTKNNAAPIVAVGNRLLLPLISESGEIKERLVIRTQTMHMALRLGAYLAREFHTHGPLLHRQVPLNWKNIWYDLTADFERIYNHDLWCCIYHNGRPLYKSGNYHPFLDVIEQCDIKNRAEYDRAVYIAQDAFKEAGREVHIDHHVNIGVVIGAMEGRIRCGLILRAPSHTSTFNFMIEEDENHKVKLQPHHGLELAACYLEGIQLAVMTGIAEYNRKKHLLDETDDAVPLQSAYKRIGRLNQAIQSFETDFKVRYRPEQPDFRVILEEARDQGWGSGKTI